MTTHERMERCGVPIYYTSPHRDTAIVMAEAVADTAQLLKDRWALDVPSGCQAWVLSDWETFLSETMPGYLRLPMWLTKPLWKGRVVRTFELAGGWMMPWPGKPTVGVKPPELLREVKATLGERLFVPVTDLSEKVRRLTCHEFTHACTAHLRLPAWLNEGVAMRSVDHLVGRPTVLDETTRLAMPDPTAVDERAYRQFNVDGHEAILRLYATGYWATRSMDANESNTISKLLKRRRTRSELAAFVRKQVTTAKV